MRNLKLQYCNETTANVPDAKYLLMNPNAGRGEDTFYVVTANKLYRCNAGEKAKELYEVPEIVGAEYLSLDNEICLATAVGEVLIYNPTTGTSNEGTFCDVGIECMAWSPDQEVVAFITKTHNVVVMTCTYESMAEHALVEQCDGDGQFMNVGWGKKETQFHGTEGKSAAKKKSEFSVPLHIENLPKNVEVTWRADGAYFAVSFVCDTIGRMFKVFDKEGTLQFTSEKVNELQPPIAWRPSGTWIAMPQRFPNKSTIALFEKNGLRHREIVLPFDLLVESIISLKWSADSDILAIETQSANGEKLYLYTIGNYHWYLKQVLIYPTELGAISVYEWDNHIGEEKTLHILLTSGAYFIYKWHYSIDKYKRSGLVAVIDGNKLLITDFSKTVVPPPMCNKELIAETYINACTLTIDDNRGCLLLCLYNANHKLELYQANLNEVTIFTKICTLEAIDETLTSKQLCHLSYQSGEKLNLFATYTTNKNTQIMLIQLDESTCNYSALSTLSVNGIVNALTVDSSPFDDFFIQTLKDATIYKITVKSDNRLKLENQYAQLPQPADHLQCYTLPDACVVGLIMLRTNQCLYLDEQCIADDVTSICLAGNYLAFTKLNSLQFIRLQDKRIVDERKIERGGKLVTTIANDSRTVLQMPRGNLEMISPRVLALEIVAALLSKSKRYNDAMIMLRKQRINLNILCDHNMLEFVETANMFLADIENPNWLCLFLSDLQNEDFTKTMYASNYAVNSQVYPPGFKIESKIQFICELLCQHMEKSKDERYRLPIITAYVKIGKLENALLLIWQQKQTEAINGTTTKTSEACTAEEMLKYLLYLVDVNELYNVALGTYDFGLVLFVAQKSQKDPKEFLPFLNELKKLELNYRKFKIDEHLKRYEKALQHISQCGNNDQRMEALAFIKKHALYQHALKCYQTQDEQMYQQICTDFADSLRANQRFENASIMYERGGHLKQAMLTAKHVLDWQRVLALARKDEQQNINNVALSMVIPLQENGKYMEAFTLLKEYGNDFGVALEALIKGKHYLQAIFESRMQPNENYIETHIRNDLIAYAGQLSVSIKDNRELFTSHKQRLLDIRKRKTQQVAGVDADNERNDVDESDLLSDTTSLHSSRYTNSSRGTGKTFRSSKNRRKHERKLLSLKPGNSFEDIALIDALHNQITKLAEQQQHLHDTIKALIELDLDGAATELQQIFKNFLNLVQDSLDEIWVPELMATQQFLTGPTIDYTQLQNEQRYAMINPQKRFKPQLTIIDWEHDILS